MKKAKKRVKIIISVTMILFILLISYFISGAVSDYTSGALSSGMVVVEIEPGDSVSIIADKLEDKGIIRYPLLFRITSKLGKHDGAFMTGKYEIKADQGYSDIIKILTSPSNYSYFITFPEGYTVKDIAKTIESKALGSEQDFLDASKKAYDFDFLPDSSEANYLEGYLFPDTYSLDSNSDSEQIINAMLRRFDEIYTDEYQKRADELGYSMHEVITLASIIEAEAGSDEDRPLVSSVFHNRLDSSYPYLESCATVQYILDKRKQVLSVADTKIDSPYNTYENKGLPPGPICNPGKASIEAALYPADTDYKYFVSDSDGKIYYSKTFEEHTRIQKEIF